MSYSQLYVADANGEMQADIEQRNGSGSGPVIWGALIWRYERELWPGAILPQSSVFEGWDELFKSWRKLSLRPWERDVLLMTFDRCLVAPERYRAMAESMRRFSDAHARAGEVEHLTGWAKRLDELGAEGGSLGAGLYLTSVRDNLWWKSVEVEDDDEYEDDSRPYNITTDREHFWVSDSEPWAVTA